MVMQAERQFHYDKLPSNIKDGYGLLYVAAYACVSVHLCL